MGCTSSKLECSFNPNSSEYNFAKVNFSISNAQDKDRESSKDICLCKASDDQLIGEISRRNLTIHYDAAKVVANFNAFSNRND